MKIAIRQFFWYLLALLGAFIIAAFIAPPVLDSIERLMGRSLSYEVLMRGYLGMMYVLLVWWMRSAALYWPQSSAGDKPPRYRTWVIWPLIILLFVLLADQKWTLTEENSWIKYPTAGALLLAGYWMRKSSKLLMAGLVFAAADELFSFHEKIGAGIERLLGTSHVTTDLVTAAYGLIGLAVLVVVLRKARSFGPWLYLGMIIFVFATVLDTFDGVVFGALRDLTDWLTINMRFESVWRFQDLWFAIYKPGLFMNGLEEVNEYVAAVLFAFAANRAGRSAGVDPPHGVTAGGAQGPALRMVGVLIIIFLATITLSRARSFSPIESTIKVTRIATVTDGLFHTDDLDFHPNWGVVVANESAGSRRGSPTGPGVFRYAESTWYRLKDPERLLVDIDSVFATSSTIYATSGATGALLAHEKGREGWYRIATIGDFPKHPEGLAADATGNLSILDESDASVTSIKSDGTITRRDSPKHPAWKAPEGIVYHPDLSAFLITDDVSGTIFAYRPRVAAGFSRRRDVAAQAKACAYQSDAELCVFAGREDGLRAPEDIAVAPDGGVVVSDNGARAIILFDQSGNRKASIRFRPLWRDLQGVTLDDQGDLYVVTADGYGSSSFVPSVLWRLTKPFQKS